MVENEKVSVIMSCYNCSKTLEKAIDSILAQTYTNWVMICCDDASKDNTLNILKEYTTGMWVQGVSEGTTTIRSTFIPGTSYKDKVKTVTNTFTVTVTKAAEQVNIGDTFTLEGTATTPYLTTKATSTNVASLWGRTSEINYNASGDGLETAQASWKVWTDTGIITHRFCINFGEMVGRTPQQSDNTTYTPSPSDSMSDKFLRPWICCYLYT